jgi:hypothetical protein
MKKQSKGSKKPRNQLIRKPLPFEEAVGTVLSAPPTPEQQAKKAARKARAEERKREKKQVESGQS